MADGGFVPTRRERRIGSFISRQHRRSVCRAGTTDCAAAFDAFAGTTWWPRLRADSPIAMRGGSGAGKSAGDPDDTWSDIQQRLEAIERNWGRDV